MFEAKGFSQDLGDGQPGEVKLSPSLNLEAE